MCKNGPNGPNGPKKTSQLLLAIQIYRDDDDREQGLFFPLCMVVLFLAGAILPCIPSCGGRKSQQPEEDIAREQQDDEETQTLLPGVVAGAQPVLCGSQPALVETAGEGTEKLNN